MVSLDTFELGAITIIVIAQSSQVSTDLLCPMSGQTILFEHSNLDFFVFACETLVNIVFYHYLFKKI